MEIRERRKDKRKDLRETAFGGKAHPAGKLRRAMGMLMVLLILTAASGCGDFTAESGPTVQNRTETSGTDRTASSQSETLEVHFLDVGQGDATLIRQGDAAMLIDAGNNDKGTTVQSYLKSQGIEHLDYVIGTHPDSDHVGGLDVVLYKFSWNQVILPDIEKDTRTYQDVLRVIQDAGRDITVPVVGDTYRLGEAEFTIIAPVKEDYGDNTNNYSVGILLSFGENRFVFTGDAEEEAEEDMLEKGMDLSADVLKASHHGSDTANTMEFLKEVSPETVVISCGEGNSYGHPRAAAMNNFRSIGASVYRTDEQGTIVAVSDGSKISWNCSPSESWQAGEPLGSRKEESESQNAGYVLNTNTGKFHLPSCGSLDQMKAENREYSSLSREELIESGYEPCGRCKP